MFRLIQVRDHERGLWFRRGNFQDLILPGSTWLLTWQDKIQIINTDDRPRLDHPLLESMLDHPQLRRQVQIVEVDSSQQARVLKNGRVIEQIGPGRHAYWNTSETLKVERFPTMQRIDGVKSDSVQAGHLRWRGASASVMR